MFFVVSSLVSRRARSFHADALMRSPRPYLRYAGLVHTQEPDVSIFTDRSSERPPSHLPFPSLVSNAVADTELHRAPPPDNEDIHARSN